MTWNLKGTFTCGAQRPGGRPADGGYRVRVHHQWQWPDLQVDGRGATWNLANTGLPAYLVYALAAGSDGSLYAATFGGGVYKSTNQGGAWAAASTGLATNLVNTNCLAVAPSNPSVLYLAYSTTLYQSSNGGGSWVTVGPIPVSPSVIAVTPSNSSDVVALANSAGAAYFSSNGGTTWNPVATGLGIASPSQVAFDVMTPLTAYVTAPVRSGGFVTEINPAGSALVFSTYLTGGGGGYPEGIAIDGAGNAYVAGSASGAFPVTSAALTGNLSSGQAFVAKLSPTTGSCTYTVSPLSQAVGNGQQGVFYSVLAPSGCSWTATSDSSWAPVGPGASGSGTGYVSVAVESNLTASARTATLTIAGQTATLTQRTVSCSYVLSPSSVTVPLGGGTVSVNLATGNSCPWTVVDNYPSAVSVSAPASGTSNATVSVTVAANPNPNSRTFSVPVGGATLSITESGSCVYSLSPTSALFSGTGGSGSVNLTAVGSGCVWSSSANNGFLSITSGGSGVGSGTVNYSVGSLTGTTRTGSLTIAGLNFPITQTPDQPYLISTFAGGSVPPTATPATSVAVPVSYGVAVDSSGNVYFPSPALNSVFKIDSSGMLTRVAGTGVAGFSGDGGPATSAQLSYPEGVAVDAEGDVFIADAANNRIRQVSPSGTISTAAGNGCCYGGDGGPATSALLNWPVGVAVGGSGIYIADQNNQRVRFVNQSGMISTLAGNGSNGFSGDGAAAASAQLNNPTGVAVDASGNVYIADSNNRRVREVVAATGNIVTFAGTGSCCLSLGDGGAPANAQVLPNGVAIDASGSLIIADGSNRIRKVSGGTISTVAGNGGAGIQKDGGTATNAALFTPYGVAADSAGNIYVADFGNARIRKVIVGGIITTIAGGSAGDSGPAAVAGLNQPTAAARDSSGNIYIAEKNAHRVRKIASDGTISTFAGTGLPGSSGDGGAAASAMLNNPQGVAVDSSGNVYIADTSNQRIRKVSAASGNITTVAGNGTSGYSGDTGAATGAQLNNPSGVALDASGNIYIADNNNARIRKVTVSTGNITTVAGNGTSGYSGDSGAATSASISSPFAVAVDSAGDIYISDVGNNRVRKVDTSGNITTYAGTGSPGFSGDTGAPTSAMLSRPQGLALDSSGNLYIADQNNRRIRKVTASGGIITTIGGSGSTGFGGDGGPGTAGVLQSPMGLAVDTAGNVYVGDLTNLRLLTPAGGQPVLTIQSAHGTFTQGQNGASYTLTVANAVGAGSTSGSVTALVSLPAGLSLVSMSGSGWSCSTPPSCTRSDALSGGSAYPPITVSVNVSASAPAQLSAQSGVAGGGAPLAVVTDLTLIAPSSAPAAPALVAPANGSTTGYTTTLSWSASPGAATYDVYAGTANPPSYAFSTTETNFVTPTLTAATTYYWSVAARNSAGSNASAIWSFTTSCLQPLSLSGASFGAAGGSGSIAIAGLGACSWTATSNASWITITSGLSGFASNPPNVGFLVAANTGLARTGTITVSGQTFTVTQAPTPLASTSYLLSTLAGGMTPPPTINSAALVSMPVGWGVGVDAAGNVYFPSPNMNVVFKVDTGGVITRVAGTGSPGFSGDSGQALAAQLNGPQAVAVDALGNLYIADAYNNRIRMVSVNGVISTIAGTGTQGSSGDGAAATSAQLNQPYGIAVSAGGSVFIADSNNQKIRKVSGGVISTVAGTGTSGYSGDGATATAANLSNPHGVAVDSSGNLYIADTSNARIRKVDGSGNITTVAGNGSCCFYSGDNGPATSAQLNNPNGVAADSAGNIYIADTNNNRLRMVTAGGTISTIAGTGAYGFAGYAGPAVSAQLANPIGVAVDPAGNVYISDSSSQRIRKVMMASGMIISLVGGATGDGSAAILGGLDMPAGAAMDASGNIYFADSSNNRIRKIDTTGNITTVAGTGIAGFSGDSGPAVGATLSNPQGVAVDSAGNLYIADTNNGRIRKVDTSGNITTVAGNGVCCGSSGDGGAPTSAQLNGPQGIAIDASGNLYISETNGSRVRKISGGTIATYAGTGAPGYSGDGSAAASAQLNSPMGLAFDSSGNLYIADSNNSRVRKVSAGGTTIATVAGNGVCCGSSGDGGAATSAQLNGPQGVAVDSIGNLYIADTNNNRVRKVDGSGNITTIAGSNGSGYSGDGGTATSGTFRSPKSVAVSPGGVVYVTDFSNDAVRAVTPAATQAVLTAQAAQGGTFTQGQTGAITTVTVTNALAAGSTSGTVSVTIYPGAGLTPTSIAGTNWNCTLATLICTRTDALAGGASYPPITVTGNITASTTLQFTTQALVTGGGAWPAMASDLVAIAPSAAPSAPALTSPANNAPAVSVTSPLTWAASSGAVSYDVYFGTSAVSTPLVASTTNTTFSPGSLTPATTYFWSVGARNGAGANTSVQFAFTTTCASALSTTSATASGLGGTGSVPVTASGICSWAASSGASWINITAGSSGTGNGTVGYSVAANTGAQRVGLLTIAGQTFTVTQNASPLSASSYLVSTVAGRVAAPTVATATSDWLPLSNGVAADLFGNVYFVAPILNAVFKTDSSGTLTRVAGTGSSGFSGDGGQALAAQLNYPNGVAVDGLGNLFIADTDNQRIRQVTPAGVISTVAGNGVCCAYAGDGGAATSAQINNPFGVAVDAAGNIYIADTNNYVIRKVTVSSGVISTVAGNGVCCGYSGDGGAATGAQLSNPNGVAVDAAGDVYIADTNNNRVRKVDLSGNISTLAGTGACCNNLGDGGPAASAQLFNPRGVAVDSSGSVYIADSNENRIRKVDPTGTIATVAGGNLSGYAGDGGAATSAALGGPQGVALDSGGNLYISEYQNGRIRRVTAAGLISTIAGGATGDTGAAVLGWLSSPNSVAKDSAGNLYIADTNNHRVRKVDASGNVTTFAGTGIPGYAGDSGPAAGAQLNYPQSVAADSSGNLYIADTGNNRIRKVDGSGNIATFAGNGVCCGFSGDGGSPASAQLNAPSAIAVDASGHVYIVDQNNQRVREVLSGGTIIQTIAGNGVCCGFSGDGAAATSAQLNQPRGIAVDSLGNVYIADANNNRVRKVDTSGNINTVAGNGVCCGSSGDGGLATGAQLNNPLGLAADAAGDLYIADSNNQRVRKVNSGGIISTIGGAGSWGYSGDGGAATSASLRAAMGLFVDASGNVYVAEQGNNIVRLLTPAGATPVLSVQSSHSNSFTLGQTSAVYTLDRDQWSGGRGH